MKNVLRSTTLLMLGLSLSACVSGEGSQEINSVTLDDTNTVLKTTLFSKESMSSNITAQDCTLSDGEESTCAQFTLKYVPKEDGDNTFCPNTINDSGGLWDWTGENAGVYKVDGPFLKMLDGIGYTFYDSEGKVYLSDISKSQPTVDHSCIQVSYNKEIEVTVLLPLNPVMAEKTTTLGTVSKVGLALDGAPIFSDAPSVQQTGHMPALSKCGGHVDPGGWFHWHATATDINTPLSHAGVSSDCNAVNQNPEGLFGYAFDGFPMYGSIDQDGSTPDDLDECNGHISNTPEYPDGQYHYHSTNEFPNLPKCLKGQAANDNFKTTAQAGIGGTGGGNNPPGGGGPGGGGPDLTQAAETLGVSVEALTEALNITPGQAPDFAAAAEKLGLTEEELRASVPPPPGR